jgi:hypothetical protein
LRQVSLDRTAKTRQLLKMAENAGRLLFLKTIIKLTYLPPFSAFVSTF